MSNMCGQLAPTKCLPPPFHDMARYGWPRASLDNEADNEAEEVMSPAVLPKMRGQSVALTISASGKKSMCRNWPPPSCTERFKARNSLADNRALSAEA